MVDLESDVSIGKIIVNNRKDCCQERMAGAKLAILDSATARNTVWWSRDANIPGTV